MARISIEEQELERLKQQLDGVSAEIDSIRQSAEVVGNEVVVDALSVLLEAGLIYRSGMGEQQRYIFKHALIQDAAYESMLKTKRHHIHSR